MTDISSIIDDILAKTKTDIDLALQAEVSRLSGAESPHGMVHPSADQFAKRLLLTSVMTPAGFPTAPPTWDFRGPPLPQGLDDWWNQTVGNCVEASGLGHILFVTNSAGTLIYPDHNCGAVSYNEVTGWNWSGIGPGTNPFNYFSWWRKTGVPIKTYQAPQQISSFQGSIGGSDPTIAGNWLTVITAPTIPLQLGSPLIAPGVPTGVTINGVPPGLGVGRYSISGAPLLVAAEPMTAKISPHPTAQGRHKIKAYMFGDPANVQLFNDAANALKCPFLLLAMPTNWRNTAIWDAPPAGHENDPAWKPDSAGGHQVVVLCRVLPSGNLPGGYLVKTWSGTRLITDAAFAYSTGFNPIAPWTTRFVYQWVVALSNLVLDQQTLLAPDGLDMPALDAILTGLGGTDS